MLGQVSARSAGSDTGKRRTLLRNVMREDMVRGSDALSDKREQLLAALPKREGDYAARAKNN